MKTIALSLALVSLAWTADKATDSQEARMQRQIRHELVMLPYYGVFDELAFRTNGRSVTLLGRVSRPSLKPDAERAAKEVDGVETVVNQIEVLPTSPNDDRIRVATYRAIYGDNMLYRYGLQAVPPIHIIVKNGNVNLVGVVANEADKNVAGLRANGVSGVFAVTNDLQVENSKGKEQ